ncbi:hypothetical protein DL770_010982 [Monosporascus sp. CRB-9-2]|nr:hypothetical protein DL770_010982 [Monosporascus sp. CRB-9-2]
MSLCFLEAFQAKKDGIITEEEYVHHLLAHSTGVEHEEDETQGKDWELLERDPFGYSIQCWCRRISPVKDATPFEDVFKAYRTGDVENVKANLGKLGKEHADFICKSLSLLALQERQSEMLKLCLDQDGFAYEGYFEDEANRVSEDDDPKTFKVLEESNFRKIYPRKLLGSEDGDEEDEDYEDPSAAFDEGGSHPVDW